RKHQVGVQEHLLVGQIEIQAVAGRTPTGGFLFLTINREFLERAQAKVLDERLCELFWRRALHKELGNAYRPIEYAHVCPVTVVPSRGRRITRALATGQARPSGDKNQRSGDSTSRCDAEPCRN